MFYNTMKSPVGALLLTSNGHDLTGLYLSGHRLYREMQQKSEKNTALFQDARRQLGEYFAGKRKQFDLPIALDGTDFQKKVWNLLQQVPYGETLSYADMAKKMGSPLASRAVGTANGKNPISLIVPCHRIIASNGAMAGYAGGVAAKKWLLSHEEHFK